MIGISPSEKLKGLLDTVLPATHPSALKHTYLSTIANVVNNPIDDIKDKEGLTHVIGFGDQLRTLPIKLLIDDQGIIMHAFPPSVHPSNPNREIDQRLIESEPRNIAAQLRKRGRGDSPRERVCHQGITRHTYEGTPFNDDDLTDRANGKWLNTNYLPMHLSHNDKREGRMDFADFLTKVKLEKNVSYSATINVDTGSKPVPQTREDVEKFRKMKRPGAFVELDQNPRTKTLRRTSVRIDDAKDLIDESRSQPDF